MRIAFDVRFSGKGASGLATYSRNLFEALKRICGDGVFPVQSPRGSSFWDNPAVAELFTKQFLLPFELRRKKADVLFVPNPPCPLFASPCPAVAAIHDLNFLKSPKFDRRQLFLYRATAKRAAHIVTPSEYSKNDIVSLLGVGVEKVSVIHSAAKDQIAFCGEEKRRAHLEAMGLAGRKYVLSVPGVIAPHKGSFTLLEAFLSLPPAVSGDLVLVIVAAKDGGGYARLWETVLRANASHRVVVTGTVSDECLSSLYSGAELFVFPSRREGFGIPPLEAMKCRAPVISSLETSLKEVVGDAAEPVDPESASSIASAIASLLACEERRNALRARGAENAKRFSYGKSALRLMEILRAVAGAK